MTCPCTSCLNLSFSGLQKEHQAPLPASSKRRSAQTGRHSDRWTLRSLSVTKKAPTSWVQPLPYHRILSMSLCQLETHYNHHCLFLAKHILIKAVTFTKWYRPMCDGLSAALISFQRKETIRRKDTFTTIIQLAGSGVQNLKFKVGFPRVNSKTFFTAKNLKESKNYGYSKLQTKQSK